MSNLSRHLVISIIISLLPGLVLAKSSTPKDTATPAKHEITDILKGQWQTICVKEQKNAPYYTLSSLKIDEHHHIQMMAGWFRDQQCQIPTALLKQEMDFQISDGKIPTDTFLSVKTQNATIDVFDEETLEKIQLEKVSHIGKTDITDLIEPEDQLTQIYFSKSLTRLFFNKPDTNKDLSPTDMNHTPYRDLIEQSGLMS